MGKKIHRQPPKRPPPVQSKITKLPTPPPSNPPKSSKNKSPTPQPSTKPKPMLNPSQNIKKKRMINTQNIWNANANTLKKEAEKSSKTKTAQYIGKALGTFKKKKPIVDQTRKNPQNEVARAVGAYKPAANDQSSHRTGQNSKKAGDSLEPRENSMSNRRSIHDELETSINTRSMRILTPTNAHLASQVPNNLRPKIDIYNVEEILDKKLVGRVYKYLIKWEGFPDEDNSWEPKNGLPQHLVEEFEKNSKILRGKNELKTVELVLEDENQKRMEEDGIKEELGDKESESITVGKGASESVELKKESIERKHEDQKSKNGRSMEKKMIERSLEKKIVERSVERKMEEEPEYDTKMENVASVGSEMNVGDGKLNNVVHLKNFKGGIRIVENGADGLGNLANIGDMNSLEGVRNIGTLQNVGDIKIDVEEARDDVDEHKEEEKTGPEVLKPVASAMEIENENEECKQEATTTQKKPQRRNPNPIMNSNTGVKRPKRNGTNKKKKEPFLVRSDNEGPWNNRATKFGEFRLGDRFKQIKKLRYNKKIKAVYAVVEWKPRDDGFVPMTSKVNLDVLKSNVPNETIDYLVDALIQQKKREKERDGESINGD